MIAVLATLIALTSYSITDGDTIRSGDLRLRIWGIDAPEKGRPGGQAATEALTGITAGQPLACEEMDVDRYGRTLARCILPDGRDIACEMVKAGHAWDWPKYSGGYYAACRR